MLVVEGILHKVWMTSEDLHVQAGYDEDVGPKLGLPNFP